MKQVNGLALNLGDFQAGTQPSRGIGRNPTAEKDLVECWVARPERAVSRRPLRAVHPIVPSHPLERYSAPTVTAPGGGGGGSRDRRLEGVDSNGLDLESVGA